MTVEKLRKLEEVIKPILEAKPQTREDDFLLYAEIIKEYDPELLGASVELFFVKHKALNVPNLKSIERARRKIQEKHPHLASERAKRKRAEEQAKYIAYSHDKT
jgi:hypothetical protein